MKMPDPLDALLDAKLRDEMPYIDDAGFTARVMQKLPRQRLALTTQRSLIILAAAIVSVVTAYFASGEGMFVRQAMGHLALLTPLQNLLVLLSSGMCLTIASLWAAVVAARNPNL